MKLVRNLVITSFVLSFAGAVWMFAGLRHELKTLRPAESMGPLRLESDSALEDKIDVFLNQRVRAKESSFTCVHDFLGRDNLFAYIDRACGEFERHPDGSVGMKAGFRSMARIELGPDASPTALAERMEGESPDEAMVKLFPPPIRAAGEQTTDARAKALFERGLKKQEAEHPR